MLRFWNPILLEVGGGVCIVDCCLNIMFVSSNIESNIQTAIVSSRLSIHSSIELSVQHFSQVCLLTRNERIILHMETTYHTHFFSPVWGVGFKIGILNFKLNE